MARRKRSVKAKTRERIIPVLPSDLTLLLNKWERMDLHSCTFIETWGWASEAARILAEFAGRELKHEEDLDD
jgi:hypothetical protein